MWYNGKNQKSVIEVISFKSCKIITISPLLFCVAANMDINLNKQIVID
jgi:hypothetical protein